MKNRSKLMNQNQFEDLQHPFIVKIYGKRDDRGEIIFHYKKMCLDNQVIYLSNICKTLEYVESLQMYDKTHYEKVAVNHKLQLECDTYEDTDEEVYVFTCDSYQLYINDLEHSKYMKLLQSYISTNTMVESKINKQNQQQKQQAKNQQISIINANIQNLEPQAMVKALQQHAVILKQKDKGYQEFDEESSNTENDLNRFMVTTYDKIECKKLDEKDFAFTAEEMFTVGDMRQLNSQRAKTKYMGDFVEQDETMNELNKIYSQGY